MSCFLLVTATIKACNLAFLQQRAREVVEWRRQQEEQQKLLQEQSAIELKQQLHLEEYQRERAGLTHLSWRQRKAALYRANKTRYALRPSERTRDQQLSLPLIIKGTYTGPAHWWLRPRLPRLHVGPPPVTTPPW